MKFKTTMKFQEGGQMAPPTSEQETMGAPASPDSVAASGAPTGGEDPLMQIAQVAAQALQNQDCQAALTVCEAFLQLIQQAAGGGAAPEQASEPTFQRKGGKIVKKA